MEKQILILSGKGELPKDCIKVNSVFIKREGSGNYILQRHEFFADEHCLYLNSKLPVTDIWIDYEKLDKAKIQRAFLMVKTKYPFASEAYIYGALLEANVMNLFENQEEVKNIWKSREGYKYHHQFLERVDGYMERMLG